MCPLRRCTVRPWRSCGRLSGRRDGFGRPSSSWATRMHLAVKSPGSGEAASPPQLPFGHAGEARATTPEPELELQTCNSPGFRAGSVESARGWCLRGGSIPLPGFLLRFESRLARRCRCFFSSHFPLSCSHPGCSYGASLSAPQLDHGALQPHFPFSNHDTRP